MWFVVNKYRVLFHVVVLISSYETAKTEAITNTNFNTSIRDYSVGDGNNITHAKTLQKEELGKRVYYIPTGTPIKFKEVPDSALSSTSNSRGLLYHDHPGYGLNDYEEGPHYDFGHDYHFQEPHPDPHSTHGYEHHDYDPHHYGGHHHYEHGGYRHHKHSLATKAVLWPLAGIALLGAAAALVTNPVLLQLGVISGKRRRRDTEEITGPDNPIDSFKKYEEKIKKFNNEAKVKIDSPDTNNFKSRILKTNMPKVENPINGSFKRRTITTNNGNGVNRVTGMKRPRSSVKSSVDRTTVSPERFDNNDDDRYVPIPIKLRSPNVLKP